MPFLPAAVASILGQALQDLTLLIVDDGSTDGTRAYLASLADPRVRVTVQPAAGLAAALNRCLETVSSDLVARMDADDVARPTRLAEQVAFMRAHPEVVVCGTWIEYFTEGGRRTLPRKLPTSHGGIVHALAHGGHGLCHPTLVYRTEAARRAGGYRVAEPGQTTHFGLSMSRLGALANLDRYLLAKRVHPGSVTWREAKTVAAAELAAAAAWRTGGDPVGRPPAGPARVRIALRSFGQTEYRRALIAYLHGERYTAALHGGAAALCDPVRAVRRVLGRASAWAGLSDRAP